MKIPSPRPLFIWIGLLLNILPFNLCLLGILDVDNASWLTGIVWIPSIIIMIMSCDFNMLALLAIIKSMELSLGHNFYPFYIGLNTPLAQVVALLVIAAIFTATSYTQSSLLKRCSLP